MKYRKEQQLHRLPFDFLRRKSEQLTALRDSLTAQHVSKRTLQLEYAALDDFYYNQLTARITQPTSTGQTAEFMANVILSDTDRFTSIKHTNMLQLYNLILTGYPELNAEPSFKAIEPVLLSNAWLHESFPSTANPEGKAVISNGEVIVWLLFGTRVNSLQTVTIDAVAYTEATLGLTEIGASVVLEFITESNPNLTVVQKEALEAALRASAHLEGDILTLHIDTKTGALTKIILTIPEQLLADLVPQQNTEAVVVHPFEFIYGDPFVVLQWMKQNPESAQIVVSFSQLNAVAPIMPPTNTVELSTIPDGKSIFLDVVYAIADPEIVLIASGADNTYVTAIHESHLLFNQGQYAQGLERANAALALANSDENQAYAYYWKGLHTYKLGRIDEAEQLLLRATQLKQQYAAPYVTLGAISMDRGNYQQMLQFSELCAAYDPQYAWCYNNQGIALLSLGQTVEGIQAFEKAVSLDQTSFVFNDNLKRARGQ